MFKRLPSLYLLAAALSICFAQQAPPTPSSPDGLKQREESNAGQGVYRLEPARISC